MAELRALIFSQDGVLADTERDGHLAAFNQAIMEHGQGFQWDAQTYTQLLEAGPSRQRLVTFYTQRYPLGTELDKQTMDGLLKSIHRRKAAVFLRFLRKGRFGLRPGVARLIRAAHAAGIRLAVCSTCEEAAVDMLLWTLLGEEVHGWFDPILAGDAAAAKKPSPEIYDTAMARMDLDPGQCLAIEGSGNGLLAAKAAGLRCVVTVTEFTRAADLSAADLVVSCLGDPDDEAAQILAGAEGMAPHGLVSLSTLSGIMDGRD